MVVGCVYNIYIINLNILSLDGFVFIIVSLITYSSYLFLPSWIYAFLTYTGLLISDEKLVPVQPTQPDTIAT